MEKYEGMLILKPQLSEEKREEIVKRLEKLIEQEKGKIKNFQLWGQRKLAYEIGKEKEGFYYLLHFSLEPEVIDKIKGSCKLDEDILRLSIIRMK